MAQVLSLMETPQLKVTAIHLIAAFMWRRTQPLQARAHSMWAYQGVRDLTRISTVEFRSTEVWRRVRRLTDLGESEPWEIDPPVAPYGPDRPREKVIIEASDKPCRLDMMKRSSPLLGFNLCVYCASSWIDSLAHTVS
ncbi:hypothetical protein BRADI_1g40235v3 [Brachypodium distachyon]|uniref:Uncharacterized protein n=1 Tax=Brachypodium distachyon TaxID=15368 RepID=A0A2K2DNM1_BRADI|nr:hypothetical protein BRADI_1g40235v3 [Brachypodium distachyon]